MSRNVRVLALRGAVGFFAGSLVLLLTLWITSSRDLCGGILLTLAAQFAAGAIGAVILLHGRIDSNALVRAAFGFGLGNLIALICVAFVMKGGKPGVVAGAVGFAIAYAVGGGIGAFFLAPRYVTAGALSFGLAAACAGAGSLWFTGATLSPLFAKILGIAFYLVPHAIAGGLFGASVGFVGRLA